MNIIPLPGASQAYLVTEGADAILIDAGLPVACVRAALDKTHATLRAVLLTHGHFDHVDCTDQLRDAFGVPVLIHAADADMMTDAEKNAEYQFFGRRTPRRVPDRLLADGDTIPLGDKVITVHHTPGHSRGSVCYQVEDALFTGDTIFAAGYGRYDLYGGDPNALTKSLASLRAFDRHLTIYPGHGGASTLGAALDNLFGLI